MVKFAEAEKRGRCGDGCDRKIAPVIMVERPKMNRAVWESVKAHIMRERRRKKEEQEADAEEQRQRKERENRKKQHAMTLEETREQIRQKELELTNLEKEKSDLYEKLKAIHCEDSLRKEQQNCIKMSEFMTVPHYQHSAMSLSSHHPQMLFQSSLVPGRSAPLSQLYKLGTVSSPNLVPAPPLKHSKSPSPPPPAAGASPYQNMPYNYKGIPNVQASVVQVTLPSTRSQPTYYHGASQPSHGSSSPYPPTTQIPAMYIPSPAPPNLSNSTSSTSMPVHQQLDHKGKPPSSGTTPFNLISESPQDKYYANVRPHLPLRTGVLPVQQPAPGSAKTGSITSGFPVRAPPPSQAPTTHSSSPLPYGHASYYRTNY